MLEQSQCESNARVQQIKNLSNSNDQVNVTKTPKTCIADETTSSNSGIGKSMP